MIFLKAIKMILLATIGGPVLALVAACLIVLMLVLLLLPGWIEILALQWDRPNGWLHRASASCWRLARKIIKPAI